MKVFFGFSRGILIIDWVLSILLVGGLRFTLRIINDSQTSANIQKKRSSSRRALIIGAGDAGAMVVKELQKNPELNLIPWVF
jgi:FlaA1/EpsC-like NDP-sugar epimerase